MIVMLCIACSNCPSSLMPSLALFTIATAIGPALSGTVVEAFSLQDLHAPLLALDACHYHPFREGIRHLCSNSGHVSHFASISRVWQWVTSKPVGLAFKVA